MADRTVNGNTHTENGWRLVDQGSCVWVKVPGTNGRVSLQIREGQPEKIMGAFAADFNAYVEPLRDADSACYTESNSVLGTPGRNNGSNHMSATAMDLDWNSHPFRVKDAGFNAAQIATIREMLAWYEDTIFWGNDWDNPKDAMHFQMGYDTYGSENVDRVQGFINRKIRADGFSTFRRGGTVTPPQPPSSNQVDILARATGVTPVKAQEILVGVINGLRDSQCTNVNRIAMWLAQIGHESAGFNATEEYQSGDESTDRWKYKGRTWIQITWRTNYDGLSRWAFGKGLIPTATYFVDNPRNLAEIQYAGLGPAWYWTVARPQINSLCDQRNLVAVTQAINGGQNGANDRKNRYDRALALGDQLLVLTTSAPSTTGDDMAQVPQDQWDRVYRELTQKLPSRSPLRHLGEGLVDTMAGFVLNVDGSQHVDIVTRLAKYGDPDALALLREVAGADLNTYPDRRHDAELAQAILADVTSKPVATVVNNVAPAETVDHAGELTAALYSENARLREENARLQAAVNTPAVVYRDEPAAAGSAGQLIGQAYDALDALRLADALPIESRAPLAALVSVLQTKNGSAL